MRNTSCEPYKNYKYKKILKVRQSLIHRTSEWSIQASGPQADIDNGCARLIMILLGAVYGLFVYLLSEKLFGHSASILSLALYSFSPNIIAHSSLVTTDAGVGGYCIDTLFSK